MALTTVSAALQDSTAQYYGFKNRIINGAMVIDQRNNGASVAVTDGVYTLDRWAFYSQTAIASKGTVQQNAGAVTPPAGFTKYLGFTSSSAYTIGAGEGFGITQKIEGQNISDLGWGAIGASSVTLSFWVRSSLTGTFGGSVLNSSVTRSYPFSYVVNLANTWEQKTVTIAGDTSGTWLTTNGTGMYVFFGVGFGSTFSGAAGSWSGSQYLSVTGATSVVGTSGATFYITGVQLEKGTVATSFDYRPYGTELALCQRYYYRKTKEGANASFSMGYIYTTNSWRGTVALPITMRTAPTFTSDTVTNFGVQSSFGNITLSALAAIGQSTNEIWLDSTLIGATTGYSAGLISISGTPWIAASSEL